MKLFCVFFFYTTILRIFHGRAENRKNRMRKLMGWDEDGDCLTITVKGKTVLTWFDSHSRLLYPPLWVVQGGTWWASSAELLSAPSSLSLFYHPAPAWILLKGQHFFLKKKICSSMGSPQAAVGICLCNWSTSSSFFSDLGVHTAVSHSFWYISFCLSSACLAFLALL